MRCRKTSDASWRLVRNRMADTGISAAGSGVTYYLTLELRAKRLLARAHSALDMSTPEQVM